jgi:SAM-dependent methyltransferase
LNQIELLNFQNKAIVDFGCKYGHSVPFLVCSGARHITGIDGYDEYLKAGASVFERLYANVKMMASNEGFIPIQSETVDLVLMIEVISHINPSYLDTVFSEVLRIMKRGGVLFIADGNNLANQGCRKALVPLYEAWENGPNGTKTDRDVVEVSFLTRRKNIIRNLYPQISTDKLDDLALNTSGLFGSYLEKTIDEFVQTGKLIRRPYLTGICPTNPIGYGTVMERGFYPQQVAMNLSQHGIEPHHVLIRAFDFFSDYASKLSVNDVAICQSDLGRSTGFHIIGIKK